MASKAVVIVGAGPSGLSTCRWMVKEGFHPVVLEMNSEIGGIWVYSDDPQVMHLKR